MAKRNPQLQCKSDNERAWEYYRHADNLKAARTNYFMVAESMLIISLVSTFFIKNPEAQYVQYPIVFLGIVFTATWFYVQKRLAKRMSILNDDFLKKDIIYKNYIESIPGPSSNFFLSYFLPIITLLFWLYFLVFIYYQGKAVIIMEIAQKILLSVGLGLTFLGLVLMIESKRYKGGEAVGETPKPCMRIWSWICTIGGFVLQILGIWIT